MIFLILPDDRGILLLLIDTWTSRSPNTVLWSLYFGHLMIISKILRILHQESVIQIDHFKLLISRRHLLRVMPWVYASFYPKSYFIGFSSSFCSTESYRDDILFDLFLPHCLNIDTVKHRHLCSELLGEFNVILLLISMVVKLD